MTKQELKAALETIIAAHPISTNFRCGNQRSVKDLFAKLYETDRGYDVVVECNATTYKKAALAIIVSIKNDLAALPDTSNLRLRKPHVAGFWNMGHFCETSASREFFPASESTPLA